jgi:hypothetical protein
LDEVYAGDELEVEYSISGKKEGNSERYGILSIDVHIKRISDNKLSHSITQKSLWDEKMNLRSTIGMSSSDHTRP